MTNVSKRLFLAGSLAAGLLLLTAPSASADGCNLDTATSQCMIEGGLFDVVQPHPTGTGVIDSFLRVQMNGTEEAFNSDTRPIMCNGSECDDYKTDPNYTTDLLTSAIPIYTDPNTGEQYLTFYLDINEPSGGSKPYLTLDQLMIYGSGTGGLSTYTTDDLNALTTGDGVQTANLLFSLDTATGCGSDSKSACDNWINLDYDLVGGGSGAGDMRAYIPIGNALDYDYIYLYSQLGCASGCGNGNGAMDVTKKYTSGDGFEEWWVDASQGGGGGGGSSEVPEPGTLTLIATGLALGIRKRRSAGRSQ